MSGFSHISDSSSGNALVLIHMTKEHALLKLTNDQTKKYALNICQFKFQLHSAAYAYKM